MERSISQSSNVARIYSNGPKPEDAEVVLVVLHGRGGSAADMLGLIEEFNLPSVAVIAPEALGNTWYPFSFLVEQARNAPYLESSLRGLEEIIVDLTSKGIPLSKIVILGFSQGACLATEFVSREPARYGGLIAFTGGLIGSEEEVRSREGSLQGTPVFLGTGDPDSHVPPGRVKQTESLLRQMGAVVDLRIYPGMGHTIHRDEVEAAKGIIQAVIDAHRFEKSTKDNKEIL